MDHPVECTYQQQVEWVGFQAALAEHQVVQEDNQPSWPCRPDHLRAPSAAWAGRLAWVACQWAWAECQVTWVNCKVVWLDHQVAWVDHQAV